MNTGYILCQRYIDGDKRITIGGIQSYITNLRKVFRSLGIKVVIIQYSDNDFEYQLDNDQVFGVSVTKYKHLRQKNKALYEFCMSRFDIDTDVLIYATEGMAQSDSKEYSISIQHGISWDVETQKSLSHFRNIIGIFQNALKSALIVNNAYNTKKLICVDYNYINWYRTQVKHREIEYEVIPNFTEIPSLNLIKHKDDIINIIFARRLQWYRGTRLFTEVASKLLDKYENINITIAGDGPDEEFMKKQLSRYQRVRFTTYSSESSLEVHDSQHIAVVPSIGSEGTSLSLLEAMASTCSVVCTDVGGMTNIVLNNYNGIIVNPEIDYLYSAVELLINNPEQRIQLAKKAYETVSLSFSHEVWENRWKKVITESINNRARGSK